MVDERLSSITSKTFPNDSKNIYKSSRTYLDRNFLNLELPELEVKITKTSTLILLLESKEIDVAQKALHHLDKFASFGKQQLQKLNEENVYDFIVKLYKAEDLIVKRFVFKLLVQFVSQISDCKKKLLYNDSLIEESKSVFMTSSDDVLQEFSGILLLNICEDPKRVDSFGRDETFLKCIFNKFKSNDVEILLQSLQLLNVIMKNSMLLEPILKHENFPIKNLQIELNNEIPEIQIAALESFLSITNFSENPFWSLLSSKRLIDAIYDLCMQNTNCDLQKSALKVFKNLNKNENIILNLSQSDYLLKFFVQFMDKSSFNRELFLSVLTEFAKLDDNRRILCENGIIKEIIEMFQANGSSEACEAISILSTNIFCLNNILKENVFMLLMNVAKDDEKEWSLRTQALETFLKLINIQGLKTLIEISNELGDEFSKFLTFSKVSFVLTSISILVKLSSYYDIKSRLGMTKLKDTVFTALAAFPMSTSITIQLFNLAAILMDQESFQKGFLDYDATILINSFLKSPSTLVRSAVCNFISAASNYASLCEAMILNGVLKNLMDNFDCSICSDAFEAILDHDLSVKFAVRGCLKSEEKIKSGFYATKGKWIDFQNLRELLSIENVSPRSPVYTINYTALTESEIKLGDRTIRRDENLTELLNEIKKHEKFSSLELHERIKFVAIKVSQFLQTNDYCIFHQLNIHLTELKFKLGSSVIPLGSLIHGNSFEAALFFKALADQLNIDASLNTDESGKGWNRVCDGTNVVDLVFEVGEMYEATSYNAQKYFQKIS